MKYLIYIGLLLGLFACNREPTTFPVVKYAGAIRNVTELNDTTNHIYLDTIRPHRRLYGFGPLSGMAGEILIVDGRPYVSTINERGRRQVKQTYEAKAPHFVYTHIRSWHEAELPRDSILNKQNLGAHLEALALKSAIDVEKPFPFLLKGRFRKITYHISDVHKHHSSGSQTVEDVDVIILGFFSKHHENIFTEPGSHVVMSFMTTSASVIGQIDQLTLKGKRVQLLLPD